MQTKENTAVKYSAALNRLQRLERSRDHYLREYLFHMNRGKDRGMQIFVERIKRRHWRKQAAKPWWTKLFTWITPGRTPVLP